MSSHSLAHYQWWTNITCCWRLNLWVLWVNLSISRFQRCDPFSSPASKVYGWVESKASVYIKNMIVLPTQKVLLGLMSHTINTIKLVPKQTHNYLSCYVSSRQIIKMTVHLRYKISLSAVTTHLFKSELRLESDFVARVILMAMVLINENVFLQRHNLNALPKIQHIWLASLKRHVFLSFTVCVLTALCLCWAVWTGFRTMVILLTEAQYCIRM